MDPRLHIVESGMVGSGCIVAPLWQMHHGYCGRVYSILQGTLSRGVATTSSEQKANILCESGFVDRTMWEGVTQAPTGTPRWERIRASISGDFSESELLKVKTANSQLCSGS